MSCVSCVLFGFENQARCVGARGGGVRPFTLFEVRHEARHCGRAVEVRALSGARLADRGQDAASGRLVIRLGGFDGGAVQAFASQRGATAELG